MNNGVRFSWVINLVVTILSPILELVTRELRDELEDSLYRYFGKAKLTDNPWDDFLAELLLRVMGFPVPKDQ